jgi:hypothetical protein
MYLLHGTDWRCGFSAVNFNVTTRYEFYDPDALHEPSPTRGVEDEAAIERYKASSQSGDAFLVCYLYDSVIGEALTETTSR